jgi:exo-1,4-beta-D-glucosaminidase
MLISVKWNNRNARMMLLGVVLVSAPFLSTRVFAIGNRVPLSAGWHVHSSSGVPDGPAISVPEYKPSGWYTASVPSTVVGTLVEDGVYPDPYFGMNLRSMPGCTYPIGVNFSNVPMPDDSPFRIPWWYRTEFPVTSAEMQQKVSLHLDGLNYRADIWLNGRKVASSRDVVGTFRVFEFDVTEYVKHDKVNILAVELFPPEPGNLALTWVDWNPTPPDKNMGLWHDAYLTFSGPVTIRHPQVTTHLDSGTARLTVSAELRNLGKNSVHGTLNARIEGHVLSQAVDIEGGGQMEVTFTPEKFHELNISSPGLWWPSDLGRPELHNLELSFVTNGQVSDREVTRFGIREITSEVDEGGTRVFFVNGTRLLIRGGGWSSDMLLRYRPARLEEEFAYIRDMHLNTVRLEGKLESDRFYDLADENGILVMAGWCCCDHWEHWEYRDDYKKGDVWDAEDFDVAQKSMRDQVLRLRNHPSLLAWLNGSDHAPPPAVEKMYIEVLKANKWPNPYLSSATARVSEVTGKSGVKMEGPYDWVPPNYWLEDTKLGGAHGFATEVSPGPAVPPAESIRRMLPESHLWPIDDYWYFHSGGGQFKKINIFTDALNARYGPAKDLEDYTRKSQLMAYEGERAMFEGYARNREKAGGVIQWMLNNAWPSMIWHLYDYYLRPAGGYFGTRKACEPLHVQFSYDDRSIVVVNNTRQARRNLKVESRVFGLDSKRIYEHSAEVNVGENGNAIAFSLPEFVESGPTYFLRLDLKSSEGRVVSSNFYWLSTKKDVLDWKKSTWYYTPTSSFADFTGLQNLPPVSLNTTGTLANSGGKSTVAVIIKNPNPGLAFAVRLKVAVGDRADNEILPILWSDNYFELLPGESRQVTATFATSELKGKPSAVQVGGWNVRPSTLRLTP